MSIKKIGWQKYEDYIEKQLSCPLLQNIVQNMIMQELNMVDEELEELEDDEDDEDYLPKTNNLKNVDISKLLPITPAIVEDVSLLANFECWIGHTNFDITHRIKNQLNNIPGVEILKILSRYRFFIGVGQMFDFQDVRANIEIELIKGDCDE